jgi:sterol desaturase/sphingolipid hydroxylase (fatty acid hydroxylase superfamily)
VLVSDVAGAVVFLLFGIRRFSSSPLIASVSVVLGFISWGFLEYVLHRSVLHGRPSMARRSHARHHADPTALISAPGLTAMAVAGAIWAILSIAFPVGVACLVVFGVYAGYNYYALLHHLHHRRGKALARVEYFARLERVHRIHYTQHVVNYGVSTTIWDRLLGTFQPSRERGHDQALEPPSDRTARDRTATRRAGQSTPSSALIAGRSGDRTKISSRPHDRINLFE